MKSWVTRKRGIQSCRDDILGARVCGIGEALFAGNRSGALEVRQNDGQQNDAGALEFLAESFIAECGGSDSDHLKPRSVTGMAGGNHSGALEFFGRIIYSRMILVLWSSGKMMPVLWRFWQNHLQQNAAEAIATI